MRLGAPLMSEFGDPDSWVAALRREGYTAAFCPVGADADGGTIRAYEQAAEAADIVIAEVGTWSNPISPDEATRQGALTQCKEGLALADEIGARCCVNISGSRGEQWDGSHRDNLTEATFELVVESVREIIDAVGPRRTWYTLETMPWMYPDSVESYVRLIEAIDRERFAVHFDPVNLVCSPQRYHGNAAMIRDFVGRLGGQIKSCHAKDTVLSGALTVHIDEARPGAGNLDYGVYLQELDRLDPDTPLLLEHLPSEEEYRQGAAYIREVAGEVGVEVG